MGQARQRGTFEQRRAAAIAAGRIKRPAAPPPQADRFGSDYWSALVGALLARDIRRKLPNDTFRGLGGAK